MVKKKDEIKIDVFSNHLVPKHEVITEKEKRELLKKYNISSKQLPSILKSDPTVKALGAKPGDVIRITRKNDLMGDIFYYRSVLSK
ncbi:DNA-directed RNA polymerase subunit H [archaeon]|nr:DNA-directed RNA polymerase subunit H [archaeon]|tara:strand:- start:2512 stop:2769 length:258 start_codon:yes stop_codon:yes gene_type:complete